MALKNVISKNFMGSVLFSCSAFALELSPGRVLDINVSQKGLTRIEVEGDVIEDLFLHPSHFKDHFHLHPKGHLFFTGEGVGEPISLAILTRGGIAQDVRLTVTSGKPEPIIFKNKPDSSSKLQAVSPEAPFKKWMEEALRGSIPSGFKLVACGYEERKAPQFHGLLQRKFSNGTYTLLEFQVSGKLGSLLDASLVKQLGDLALVFSQQHLTQQGAKLYVIRPEK